MSCKFVPSIIILTLVFGGCATEIEGNTSSEVTAKVDLETKVVSEKPKVEALKECPNHCDDGIACTLDTCDSQTGKCTNHPSDAYCPSKGEKCIAKPEGHVWVTGCVECTVNDDCDDNNPQTKDTCGMQGKCFHDAPPKTHPCKFNCIGEECGQYAICVRAKVTSPKTHNTEVSVKFKSYANGGTYPDQLSSENVNNGYAELILSEQKGTGLCKSFASPELKKLGENQEMVFYGHKSHKDPDNAPSFPWTTVAGSDIEVYFVENPNQLNEKAQKLTLEEYDYQSWLGYPGPNTPDYLWASKLEALCAPYTK